MKKFVFALSCLFLVSCQGGTAPIDAKKYLSAQPGPTVPSMQESLVDSAKNEEKMGNYSKAVLMYQQALAKDHDNPQIVLALAECLRRGGDTENAIIFYDQLLAKDPSMIDAKEGKALALLAKGDFASPIPLLTEVKQADPKRWKTLNAFGIILATQGSQEEAQKYFASALEIHADNPSILNNMGLSQAMSGKYDPAVVTLTKAAELSPAGSVERKRIDLNTALVYAIAGKIDDAGAIAKTYLSGAALDNNMGLYAHLANDDDMAKAYLNMALSDSKVYYSKAWDNLQDINSISSSGNPTDPKAASPAKSHDKQKSRVKPTSTLIPLQTAVAPVSPISASIPPAPVSSLASSNAPLSSSATRSTLSQPVSDVPLTPVPSNITTPVSASESTLSPPVSETPLSSVSNSAPLPPSSSGSRLPLPVAETSSPHISNSASPSISASRSKFLPPVSEVTSSSEPAVISTSPSPLITPPIPAPVSDKAPDASSTSPGTQEAEHGLRE